MRTGKDRVPKSVLGPARLLGDVQVARGTFWWATPTDRGRAPESRTEVLDRASIEEAEQAIEAETAAARAWTTRGQNTRYHALDPGPFLD